MLVMNATDVRNDWSTVTETVIREKPAFIKRTRDHMVLMNITMLESLLTPYTFTAQSFVETDGSITLSLDQIDLIENGKTEAEAKQELAKAIIDYAEDYYNQFSVWNAAPNRKAHFPYVLKSLILNDPKEIGELIQCQAGKS